MIYDNIRNRSNYKDEKLNKVFDVFEQVLANGFIDESVVIEKDVVTVNPVTLTTKPESECPIEAHKTYADVHFIVEGTEVISTNNVSELEMTIDYKDGNDISFYEGETTANFKLNRGDFLVMFAGEAHQVGCMDKKSGDVKKLVAKILF